MNHQDNTDKDKTWSKKTKTGGKVGYLQILSKQFRNISSFQVITSIVYQQTNNWYMYWSLFFVEHHKNNILRAKKSECENNSEIIMWSGDQSFAQKDFEYSVVALTFASTREVNTG